MSPQYTALCKYRIMWLYCMFDLPTNTKKERHDASTFRKDLIKDGFTMLQFSVYVRHCASNESAMAHIERVRKMIPEYGLISILKVTDKQFGDTVNMVGRKRAPPKEAFDQLELF